MSLVMIAKKMDRQKKVVWVRIYRKECLFLFISKYLEILNICRVPSVGLDLSIFVEFLVPVSLLLTQPFKTDLWSPFLPIQNFLESMDLLDLE